MLHDASLFVNEYRVEQRVVILNTYLIDPEEAADVLNDPWVYDRITSDFSPKSVDDYPRDTIYLGGYANGSLVSVFNVHLFELGYKIHFQTLRPYLLCARELFEQALDYIMPTLKKVYCEIADLYPSVINFARKSGFREVQVNEQSFLKNGRWYDRHLMVLES